MSVSFSANSADVRDVMLCGAVYKNNELIDVNVSYEKLTSDKNTYTIPMNELTDITGCTMRAFVFDKTSLYPIASKSLMPFIKTTGSDVIAAISLHSGDNAHPRLYLDKDDIPSVNLRINSNDELSQSYDLLINKADTYLGTSAYEYELIDGKLYWVHEKIYPMIQILGTAYTLSGEDKYAERLCAELEACSEYPDWNPTHFLDTAIMSFAFAEGYDWAYDYINDRPELKSKLLNAAYNKGIKAFIADYNGVQREGYKWVNSVNIGNWNVICNGAAITLALCFAEEFPDECAYLLDYAFPHFEKASMLFAPDGASYEGVSYWAYALRPLINTICALRTSTGTDYGFMSADGISQAGYFPFDMMGDSDETFNFSNTGSAFPDIQEVYYLADVINNIKLSDMYYTRMHIDDIDFDRRGLIWYKSDFNELSDIPKRDSYYRDVEVCTLHGDNIFTGMIAGDNSVENAHLNAGSFILDINGVRFASDFGRDSEYSNTSTEPVSSYRKRAEGHNTLVFNPDSKPDQIINSYPIIDSFVSGVDESYALCNMTTAYTDDVKYALRGIRLTDNKKSVLVQDDIVCISPSELYWFMQTKATIEFSDDFRTAYLANNGVTIKGELLTEGVFSEMPAAPLVTSPQQDSQSDNSGYRKLAIHFDEFTSGTIAVRFSPLNLSCSSDIITPISKW